MKRKWLAVGIILIFLVTYIISAIAQDTEKPFPTPRGNWLYVGGSGPGNYTRIQDAIDNASAGDSVFVYEESSPYYEHIVIDKSIMLKGEDRDTVIVNGGGTGKVLYSKASNVTICGFTIQNSGNNMWEDAGIYIDQKHNNIITGNRITNNGCGIYCFMESSPSYDYHVIADNIITNNSLGVFLDGSYNNEVYENDIENNKVIGIFVGSSIVPSKDIEYSLDENEFYNNIYRNTIIKNHHGVYMNVGFYNNVFENTITNNCYGIYLVPGYLLGCSFNTFYQNNINNNTYGIFAGDDLGSVIRNVFSKNNIMYNSEGITFSVYESGPWYTKITRNTISYNNLIGNTNTYTFEYSLFNRWIGNYWEKSRLLPYPLTGKLRIFDYIISWITFDWHPVQEPYDIPGME